MKTAFIFPGQGAQQVGMGKDVCDAFPDAKDIFDRAEAATGLEIKKLCFDGPEDALAQTDVCQPAIFTVSAALLAAMDHLLSPEQLPKPEYMAGLSLGEYTALYAAGAMDFETGVKLVARRGAAMQEAAVAEPSGMVSVIGLDEVRARELCEKAAEGEVLTCANFNCPGQVVLSGAKGACERAAALAGDMGARGAVPLAVAGAFHSAFMAPAARKLEQAIRDAHLSEPTVSVIANIDAAETRSVDEIRTKLVAQLTGSVRWQQSMEVLLAQGVERYYEIGPGRVLAGLMRRLDRKAEVACVNSRESLEKLLEG